MPPSNSATNGNNQHISYQSLNTATTIPSPAGQHLRPMGYLTSQQRKHKALVLSLLCAFFAVVGSLVLWRLSLEFVRSESATAISDEEPSLSRDQQQQRAQIALDRLNRQDHGNLHPGCESTMLVIRHCEKVGPNVDDKSGNKHCSYLGFERAAFLATLFGNASISRWPTPSRLYALYSKRDTYINYREWETLLPVSKKAGVDIAFVEENADRFASERYLPDLQSGDLCGKVSVVCWRHGHIPLLVNALGCGPDNGCPVAYPVDTFDQVWQLKFVYRPPSVRFVGSPEDETVDHRVTTTNEVSNRQRGMKHHHHHPDNAPPPWTVYASVTNQFFDPLEHSKTSGDYPDGGTLSGGQWHDEL